MAEKGNRACGIVPCVSLPLTLSYSLPAVNSVLSPGAFPAGMGMCVSHRKTLATPAEFPVSSDLRLARYVARDDCLPSSASSE